MSQSELDDDLAASTSQLDLNFDDLSIPDPRHARLEAPGHNNGSHNHHLNDGAVDRLYDDDFDGMLDDLNRELPAHACA